MITKKRKREELQLLRDEALDAYLNREDFQYDVNADALYQRYKDSYTQLGKTAMEDTLGRASALTGGYGSSYAQNVGQQAYQSYLSKADDVIPELYQLAYERYRDESKRLYRNYQAWARQEQEAAQQEQREYELALQKQHRAIQNSRTQTTVTQPDYWAMLSYHQNLGKSTESKSTATSSIPDQAHYDNGKVSEGNIKTMQRLLGLTDTGKWTILEQETAGNRSADDAWLDYQQGKLQSRSKSGMTMEEWADHKSKQSKTSTVDTPKKNSSRVQDFIAGTVTEDQAAERGINATEWKMMVVDRLNRVSMTVDEFEQLEQYYGLDIPGAKSNATDTVGSSAQKLSYAQYREKTAAKKRTDLETAVQQYFDAYQAFANSAVSDLRFVRYDNAAYMRNTRAQTAKDLKKQASALTYALHQNSDLISGNYNQLHSLITSTLTGVDSIMDTFDSQANYASGCATEEEFIFRRMSSDEIAAEQDARATAREDYDIAWELSQTLMPYDAAFAESDGYTKEEFNDVENKRKYIEEKYDVDLHSDIYQNVYTYRVLLEELSKSYGDIAYTTKDGQNVTLQKLYDWKFAEEDLANRLASYSKNPDWEEKSKNIDVGSDPDRKSDYSIALELSRTNVAYDKEIALANGTSEAEWNDIEEKRQYINQKYGVNLHASIYDEVVILNEIMGMLDDYSVEGGELTQQLWGERIGNSFKNIRHLTEDEMAVLNYIFNTQGRDAALQWHNSRMSIYQDRANGVLTEEMFNWGKDKPFWSSVASVAMTLGSAAEQIGDWISGDYNNSFARAKSSIRSGVSATTDIMIGEWDVFDFLYNTTMSGIDSLAAAVLPGGAVVLGLSAAAQATNDALDRGVSKKQAFWTGLMAGTFETIFEKWSIGNLKALKTVANAHGKEIILNIAKSMLVNASEETLTEIANIAYDTLANGDFSQYETKVRQYVVNGMTEAEAKSKAAQDLGWQVAEAGLSGAFMGLGFGAIGSAGSMVQNVAQKITSNKARYDLNTAKSREAPPQIITETAVSEIDKNIAADSAKASLKAVVDNQALVDGVSTNKDTSVNQEYVAKQLMSKGFNATKSSNIAEVILARLNGQELTSTQSKLLRSATDSPVVLDVISNIMRKRSAGIDSSQNNVYDEINTVGGNKNGRETALWNLQNQRADGSLSGSRGGTRATNEDGSGVSGTLGENGGIFEKTLPTARRGLTSDIDVFSDGDYATVTEGSSLHQVQNAFKEEYGIECYIIKNSSWTRSSPAYSRNGIVYIREDIDPDTLSTAVPHEATHVMKQQNFQPYIDVITNTPDWLNFRSETVQKFLKMIADHIKIDPFTANNQQLFRYYDELNSTVYGLYKSGVLDSNEFDFREYIPGAFNDFTSYIQELDRIHEQFRNRRNASGQTKAADGGVDALMNLANEVTGVSSARMQSTLTSQTDKVNQKANAGNVVQPNSTSQVATNQTNTSMNPAEVAESLKGKGIPSQKIDTLAAAIVARVNGQELTRTQRDVLRSELGRPSVQNVISELIKKKSNGIDSAQNRVYDDSDIRDGLTNEENATLQNLSDQGVDSFRNHDHETVIDGAALHQFQNAFSEETYEGDVSVPRPTWRQSELDAVADFPEYKAQKSFMNGKEVPYGTKGSVRPDYYKSGFSVDIKNYNIESASGRSNLVRNIEAQHNQRIENLPDGTKQVILIDVRGQNVSISALLVLYNDIIQRTNNGVEVLFKMN